MDGKLLRWLYHRLLHDPTLSRTRDCTYSNGLIALIYFFMALTHHAPPWACDRRSWPIWCQARLLHLPSVSQFNRRVKTPALEKLIDQLNQELRDRLPRSRDKAGDGKPLVVGGFSHDPDAHAGKIPDGWGRGYKLHLIIDAAARAVDAFVVTALDAGEATVLRRELLPRLNLSGCVLRADANYDSNPTYRQVAQAGGRFIAPRRKPGTGLGHHPQHPDRLKAVAELEHTSMGLAQHKRLRNPVEQTLAQLGNLASGLWALPNFVRRLKRVRRWVLAKITLYHFHRILTLPFADGT
jgi:hypothetical protein